MKLLFTCFISCLASVGEEIRIRVGPAETRRSITGLEPFTWYKMVLSVQTRFGEGQSSKPLVNRTTEGGMSPISGLIRP